MTCEDVITWTMRVTEWKPRNGRRNQGKKRVRWRDEIGVFAGPSWSSLTSGREVENVGKGLCPAVD